jgi:hypothetical protein
LARNGYDTFWKVDAHYWTTVISSKPIQKNAITKVTFYLLKGSVFMFGCGQKDIGSMWNSHVGGIRNT